MRKDSASRKIGVSVAGGGGLGCEFGDVEDELTVAEGDTVPRLQPRGSGDFPTVEESAVFGRHIVEFAAKIRVNHDRAVAARNAFVANHHVVIRQPANAIHPQMQRVDIHTVFQVKGELTTGRGRERGATARKGRMGGGGIGGSRVGVERPQIPGDGQIATSGLQSCAGGAKGFSPRLALEVNAVESGVAHAASCGRSLF